MESGVGWRRLGGGFGVHKTCARDRDPSQFIAQCEVASTVSDSSDDAGALPCIAALASTSDFALRRSTSHHGWM
ncbi:hypothetical protein BV25DRAFT_1820425 [Artomyces pyxidatus]|uniref:Uncharacterized protein n=1 Tax=Artomyces pyxidatus TaxID=48021 RepID=A0ACB8TDH2_9AGAM|nr:hypothetical protein BV25DRAFT_1820425 [Artomyces pyxidatus]